MNRREAIKAGLACAIAPIIPIEAVKANKEPNELYGRSLGLEDTMSNEDLWHIRAGSAIQFKWCEGTQSVIKQYIIPSDLYRGRV